MSVNQTRLKAGIMKAKESERKRIASFSTIPFLLNITCSQVTLTGRSAVTLGSRSMPSVLVHKSP